MIKILIVENEAAQLRIVKDTIRRYFGDQVELYPKNIENTENDLNDLNYLIEALQGQKFEEVALYYQHADLFIIDACLTTKIDKFGIEFFEYLKDKKWKKKFIVFSNIPDIKGRIGEGDIFVSKLDLGIEHYPRHLVELIRNMFQLKYIGRAKDTRNNDEDTSQPQPEISSNDMIPAAVSNEPEPAPSIVEATPPKRPYAEAEPVKQPQTLQPAPAAPLAPGDDQKAKPGIFRSFINRVKEMGFGYVMWLFISNFIFKRIPEYLVNPFIFLFFYVLLAITVFFGGFNIVMDFVYQDHSKDNTLLATAEHIFLNLLPMFIVFGFFNYYKSNIRIWMLEGNTFAVNEEKSTKAMNMSKILFISSIISYVLIKITELIFFPEKYTDPDGTVREKEIDIYRLSASGIFLLILMSYFIFLDRHHQPDPKTLKPPDSSHD